MCPRRRGLGDNGREVSTMRLKALIVLLLLFGGLLTTVSPAFVMPAEAGPSCSDCN